MPRNLLMYVSFSLGLLLVIAVLPDSASAQVTTQPQQTFACPDQIKVVRLEELITSAPEPNIAKFQVTIRNQCAPPRPPATFQWAMTVNGTSVGSGAVTLASGDSITRIGRWVIRPGPATVVAEADPDNSLVEPPAYHANNSLTLALPNGTEPCNIPDKVSVETVSLTPESPTVGAEITVRFGIYNRCPNARTFPWQVSIDGVARKSSVTGIIGPHGTSNISWRWNATAGAHSVLVQADPESTLHEQERINNRRTVSITVTQ